MKINELRDKVHANAFEKGFYEIESEINSLGVDNRAIKHAFFAQRIALIHSELSEALEADRKNERAYGLTGVIDEKGNFDEIWFKNHIKDKIEDELADVIIRVLDLCGWLNIDIEKHIELKMKYNDLRDYKHNKNY